MLTKGSTGLTGAGMHHSDRGYNVYDPALTAKQRAMVEFPECWLNLPTQEHRQNYDGNPGLTRLHPSAAAVSAHPRL